MLQLLEAYNYSSLQDPSKCIRLFHLRDRKDGEVHGSLVPHFLLESPRFHALSYTWRNPTRDWRVFLVGDEYNASSSSDEPTSWIRLDGERIRVGRNLHSALQTLPVNELESIWIDALCVNQGDLDERAAQVRIMGDIYSQASQVTIWLGPGSKDMGNTLDGLSRISEYQLKANPTFSHDYWPIPDEPDLITVEEARSFSLFFARSYFSRIWVIQEVAAASKAIAYCGSSVLPWQDILRASFHIYRHRWNTRLVRKGLPEVLKHDATIHAFALQPFKVHRIGIRSFCGEMRLDYILYLSRNSESTDPRDKVYANIGLINISLRKYAELSRSPKVHSRAEDYITKMSDMIDYRKTLAKLYTEATRLAIEWPTNSADSLSMLTMVPGRFGLDVPDLPSWVPNWTQLPINALTGFYHGVHHDAAGGRISRIAQSLSLHSTTLVVEGVLYDTVSVATGISDQSSMVKASLEWFRLANDTPRPYPTGEPTAEVLWRTLCHNNALAELPAPARLGSSFRMWTIIDASRWLDAHTIEEYETMLIGLGILDPETWKHLPLLDLLRHGKDSSSEKIDEEQLRKMISGAREFQAAIDPCMAHQRLCKTGKGLLATAPPDTRIKDEIWVLLGSHVPIVLRPVSTNTYEVIGPAYVHGVMNGEALEGREDQLATIDLI